MVDFRKMRLKLGVVDQRSDFVCGPGSKKKILLVNLGELDVFFNVFVTDYGLDVGV